MLSQQTTEQRYVLFASAALAILVVATWLGVGLFGQTLAESIVVGSGPFAYLQGNALRLLVGVAPEDQATELAAQMQTILGRLTTVYVFCQGLLLWGSQRHPKLFTDFFTAESHAFNLAVLRICFFAALIPRPSLKKILHLVSLPEESRVAPPGLSWFVQSLPESPQFYVGLYWIFVIACVLAAIGLWTRYAAIVATLATFYLMGITQIFGKIEHQHYMVWVGALLAASRSADVLSVDAWRSRSRWLDQPSARAYALPLRFVWLFLGVLYFFPGLWKYVISGPEWFLSDNMRSRMLLRMFVSEGWEPLVRMDQYPLLCKVGGLAAILWEIGFVLLVFLPWWRYLAVVVGLSFHWMVKLFLGISFWPIQVLYLTFFDWHRLVVWLLGRSRETAPTVDDVVERKLGTRAVTCLATIVLLGNTACGFILLDSWPFGVYPTFARVIGPTFQSLSFIPVDDQGNELEEIEAFFDPTVRKNYGVGIGRLGGILEHVTRAHPDRPQRLQSIWAQWHEHHAEIQNVAEVRFYMVDYSTVPEHSKEPIGRTLLETITPTR